MKEKVLNFLSELPLLEKQLSSEDIFQDQRKFRELSARHKYLLELQGLWDAYETLQRDICDATSLKDVEANLDMLHFLEDEVSQSEKKKEELEEKIQTMLVPPDPDDNKNAIIEIRAGTGGNEAAIFVGDCVRMYTYYAQRQGWSIEFLSSSPTELGGFKEYQFVLSGENVYRFMKYEAGTHRVQRVPKTEAQGRLHTSTITVAVLLEPDEKEDLLIEEKDIRVDTHRSSGSGGQHLNTTDSAVRMTHIPTGIVVHCQQERSQIQNRELAMRLLKAKIADRERQKKREEVALIRSTQVGTGERSERIRTYNFPQNRLTDHRVGIDLFNLEQFMKGEMDPIIHALVSFYYQKEIDHA